MSHANVESGGGTLDHVDDTVKAGYTKQYELLKQWITDPEQPMAQYVFTAPILAEVTDLRAGYSPSMDIDLYPGWP